MTCDTRIGGLSKNIHAKRRNKVNPKTGGSDKMLVAGVVERGGEVRAKVVSDVRSETLFPHLIETVTPGSTIYTDEAAGYRGVTHLGFIHARVSHSQGEYVRAEVHTNSIEGFWSQLKRSINGTFHHVGKKHLQAYVDEFAFRYNRRASLRPMFSHVSDRVAEKHETAA